MFHALPCTRSTARWCDSTLRLPAVLCQHWSPQRAPVTGWFPEPSSLVAAPACWQPRKKKKASNYTRKQNEEAWLLTLLIRRVQNKLDKGGCVCLKISHSTLELFVSFITCMNHGIALEMVGKHTSSSPGLKLARSVDLDRTTPC